MAKSQQPQNRAARRKVESPQHINTTQPTRPMPTQGEPQQNNCNSSRSTVVSLQWIGKGLGQFLVVGVTLLGAVTFLYDFSPKISVSPLQLIDPHDAFSAPFAVANDGYLSLNRTSSTCVLKIAKFETIQVIGVAVSQPQTDNTAEMGPGEKMTVKCRFRETIGVSEALKVADILISIEYKPWIWPATRKREFRFETARNSDGTWQWLPQPVSK